MAMFGALPSGAFSAVNAIRNGVQAGPTIGGSPADILRTGLWQSPTQMSGRGDDMSYRPYGMQDIAAETARVTPKLGLPQQLGLIGDILAGNNRTAQRLQPELEFALQQQQMQQRQQQAMYNPQTVNGNIVRLNPQTGQYETLYSAPQQPAGPSNAEKEYEFYKRVLPPDQFNTWVQGQVNPLQWIKAEDPATGGISIVPVPRGGGVAPQPAAGGSATLPPGYTVRTGGASQPGSRPFP